MGFWEHTSSETLKWLLCACASGAQQELWHGYKEILGVLHFKTKRWPKRLGPLSDADWMVMQLGVSKFIYLMSYEW